MITQIRKLADGENLTYDEARGAMDEIMGGEATDAQISGFLTALRIKGETVDEITACAEVMREKAAGLAYNGDLLDIVGTGGDCAGTFNISSVSAIIAAAAGAKVAKHGNRSVSSKCGAADLFEALGVKLDITPEQNARVLAETGICFMFAPVYHQSMKYAAGPRRELGIRTIFNILGPLANPAGANLQLLGVYSEQLLEPLSRVLAKLGVKRALTVCGKAGAGLIDELSLCGGTSVCELDGGSFKKYALFPSSFGLSECGIEGITGGGPKENAAIALGILNGQKGPKRDAALMNTAAALYIYGIVPDLASGVRTAEKTIDSGKAAAKLRELIEASNR